MTDADRLDKLEASIAYQDQAIEDLSRTVTDQWTEIAELKRIIGNLRNNALIKIWTGPGSSSRRLAQSGRIISNMFSGLISK